MGTRVALVRACLTWLAGMRGFLGRARNAGTNLLGGGSGDAGAEGGTGSGWLGGAGSFGGAPLRVGGR